MQNKKFIHPLQKLFEPQSVALVGVSRNVDSVGYGVLANMLNKSSYPGYGKPYIGKLYVVNPKAKKILGQKCYSSISQLPTIVDLAVIMVPATIVSKVLEECGQCGIKNAVIISAGFAEVGNNEAEKQLLTVANQYGIRLVGPNCLGIINTRLGINATFAPATPRKGNTGFLSQSGAIIDATIDLSTSRRAIGYSHMISIGNQCDVSLTELIDYLGQDVNTDVISGYIESLKNGKEFIRVCKEVSKKKPIFLIKSGRTVQGNLAAASHTGKLAGSFEIFAAACRQAGVVLLDTLEDLFDTIEALTVAPPLRKNAIAIITNAGGAGVLCSDACEDEGLKLCHLSQSTLDKLAKSPLMNPHFSGRNPLDIVGDAGPDRYKMALEEVVKDPQVGGILILETLQNVTNPLATAKAIVAIKNKTSIPIICAILGGEYSQPGIDYLRQRGVLVYTEILSAVKAMKRLQYKK